MAKSKIQDVKQEVLAAMREAGIRPEVIYAYEKTGFLLTEEGYKSLSPQDRAEYDAAFDEYEVVKDQK